MYKLEVEWRGISTSADEEPLEGYMVRGLIVIPTSRCTSRVRYRSKYGNIINRFVMRRSSTSMDRNTRSPLIICLKTAITSCVFKLGHSVVKGNTRPRRKNFDSVSSSLSNDSFVSSFFCSLDEDGRLLIRKYFFILWFLLNSFVSLASVYNPDTSLLYHNGSPKHVYCSLNLWFMLLAVYCLFQ